MLAAAGILAACAGPKDAPGPAEGGAEAAPAGDDSDPPSPEVEGPGDLAFVHANVVAMETAQVQRDVTVLVSGGTIIAVGQAAVPKRARVVDARGKWLIPGLADMHVHLDGTRGMLSLFVAAGVTTVRNMAGSPKILALRDRVARGELLGPRIYTAGPFVDGPRPRWEASDVVARPEDAETVVAAQAAAGYDFIKVYNGLSRESYDAVAAAARAHHLTIAGHVPFAVPLAHALATEQASIEHLSGFLDAIERRDSPVRGQHTASGAIAGWLYTDAGRVANIAAEAARHGVWSCPTLITSVVYGELWRGRIPATGALDAVSPDWLARWDPEHSPRHPVRELRRAMEQAGDRELAAELAVVRELTVSGAPLLAGTDTPNPYVVPGASLHQELALFAAAGLSPYTALRAATVDAADFLGDPRAGRIAPGARADLVLLDADPLADLGALEHIAGVALGGRWLGPDDLRAMHEDMVAEYRAPAWLHPIVLPDAGARAIQYVVSDNSAAVGAYAMARAADAILERQTLEDETITARASYSGRRLRALSVDVERAAGSHHVEHGPTESQETRLIGWLTPASALALIDGTALEPDERIAFEVAQPDRDAPDQLRRGDLSIRRVDDGSTDARTYRIRLTIEHGTWTARLVLDPDGLVHKLEVSDVARPVVRTWRRSASPQD
jgi:imidazolonepropionase-like amidohydrolase